MKAAGAGAALLFAPALVAAATIDGSGLSPLWGLPFAGVLLSIAVLPLVAARLWHRHQGKIVAGWAVAFLLPAAFAFGPAVASGVLAHTLVAEYIPFTLLLVALYTAAGGIHVRGHLHGSPGVNVAIMAVGALLASVMGTTGAAMLMIRPLLAANAHRRRVAHVVVFFIFTVGNAGGALTPLGDPPLFLGFLQGVDFFWTARHIWPQTLFLLAALLAIFYAVDAWHCRREGVPRADPAPAERGLGLDGAINFVPLLAVAGLVLMSGIWKPGIAFDVYGMRLELQQIVRDGMLVAVTLLSLALTPAGVRERNQFSWLPMQEVAKLFIGIFVTMIPVLAMLEAGPAGPLAAVARAATGPGGEPVPWASFWFSGVLSSFLDNAPTYLVFFKLAGGDAAVLMTRGAETLAAISAGSVFMGALTYIGNAPNLMVKAIAEDRGVAMPGFFGYMAWSVPVLLPLFAVITFIGFR